MIKILPKLIYRFNAIPNKLLALSLSLYIFIYFFPRNSQVGTIQLQFDLYSQFSSPITLAGSKCKEDVAETHDNTVYAFSPV